MGYNSKYTGKDVERLLDKVNDSGTGSAAYPLVEHGTGDTTFTLTPNTFHVWGEVDSLDLSLGDEIPGMMNEYLFEFSSGVTPTTLSLPEGLSYVNSPSFGAYQKNQVSILNNMVAILSIGGIISVSIYGYGYQDVPRSMTWEQISELEDFGENFSIVEGKVLFQESTKLYYDEGGSDPVLSTDFPVENHIYYQIY